MANMKDVAREAGVSISTVSHVINKTRHVERETLQRVNDAIGLLDYEPSALARALKLNRTHTLGMLVPSSTNPFFAEVVQGVEEACYARGYSLLLCNSDNNADRQLAQFRTLIQKQVDALVVMTNHEDPVLDQQLSNQQALPMVVLDAEAGHNGCTIGDNSRLGGTLAGNFLIEQGCTEIACLTGPKGHPRSDERLQGFQHALQKNGQTIREDWIIRSDFTTAGGYQALQKLLDTCPADNRPAAIFAFNDLMALGVYRAVQERGLHIPDNISVIGYDDLELVSYLTPALTTIRQPSRELGEQAAFVLIDHLQQKIPMPADLTLTPTLITRESVKLRAPAS